MQNNNLSLSLFLFFMVTDSLGQELGQSVVGREYFVLQYLGHGLGRFSWLEWLESRGLESSGGLFCHVWDDSMPGLSGTIDQRELHVACPRGLGVSQNGSWVPKRASRRG